MKIKAEDRGSPTLSSTVTVYMNVKDTNDNEPAFDPQSYSVEIREDVAIGTSVAMVSATDTDSGRFSSYCIKKSNKQQFNFKSINYDTTRQNQNL